MFCTAKFLVIAIAFVIVTLVFVTNRELAISYYGDLPSSHSSAAKGVQRLDHGVHKIGGKLERYDLTQQECGRLLPLLNTEINLAKSRGHIGEPPRRDDEHGFLRARIHNGNLYVINRGEDVHHRQYAILSSIYRALITAPPDEVIPNIEFTFCVNDHPQPNIWSLARSDAAGEVNNTWLMPDYSYWSWPEPQIGAVSEIRDTIVQEDRHTGWNHKINKAVWRGTVHWNQELRSKLMSVSGEKWWADIQELEWGKNDLTMEEFCKYRFLIYTEGVTYSGRLKYQQLCRSVILTPKMQWNTMLSPMVVEEGYDQNIVVVKDDWSDLEEQVRYLQTHPRDAERIAENNVKTFRDLYMSSGAETCYWRELFRAWSEVTDDVGNPTGKELGLRWESFMLMGKLEWGKHA